MSNAARRTDNYLSSHCLGDLFSQSHEKGLPNLPIVSLTMDRGLVLRDDVERRVETTLPPEGHRLVRKGELAYNMMRMWQGVCRAATFDCLVSPAYVVLHPRSGVDSTFAEYLLRFEETVASFRRLSFGVVDDRLRLYFKDFRRIEVAIPSSENVQRKIALILTTIDNLIEKTESLIAKYQAIKQGMMHDLFTRGVDENGHLRPAYEEAPDFYKPSELGWIPKEWESKTLNDQVSPNRPIVYGILMPGYGHPGGIPVIKVKDIKNGVVDTENLLLTSPEIDHQYRRSKTNAGDLLFTIRGTVGRTAFVPQSLDGANITQDTARVGIVDGDARFIRGYLEMPLPARFVATRTLGVAVQGINLGDVRKIPIAYPSPSEQRRIGDILELRDKRLVDERRFLAKLETVKAGLMQDLLTGKVRVKVDDSEGTNEQ